MSGLLSSKTINNESSVVNSGTNLVVNSVTTLSSTEAITAKGSITITPSSSTCSLYLDNYYIRRDNFNNITYFATGDKQHSFWTDNTLRMFVSSLGLVTTVPLSVGTNGIFAGALYTNLIASSGTTGPLVIDPNFSTNNYVQINDKLVVNGTINSTGNASFGSILYINDSGLNANFQMTNYGHCHMNMPSSGNYFNMNCNLWAITLAAVSDDRIKTNETLITNATETLLKLRPEIYDKYDNFGLTGEFHRESGLVIQEVWNIEELRHLVCLPPDADIEKLETIQSIDPNNDPNYNSSTVNWGSTAGALNYNGLIAYLVKSIQELNARINVLEGV